MVDAIKEILLDDALMHEITQKSFKIIDKDGSGKIDLEELEQVIARVSSDMGTNPPSKEDMKEVFDNLDKDKSGTIEYDEFFLLIKDILIAMVAEQE